MQKPMQIKPRETGRHLGDDRQRPDGKATAPILRLIPDSDVITSSYVCRLFQCSFDGLLKLSNLSFTTDLQHICQEFKYDQICKRSDQNIFSVILFLADTISGSGLILWLSPVCTANRAVRAASLSR